MRKVGLFEAKQKLSELVEKASQGERVGITRRGKLAAVLSAPHTPVNVKEVFKIIEQVRKNANRRQTFRIRDLIDEGRT